MAGRLHVETMPLELADGRELPVAVAVPEVPEGRGAPLVLALHYGWKGELPERMGRDFLRVFVEPAYHRLGAVIVSPNCPGTSWRQPESIDAVLRLRQRALEELPVDAERVLLTGFSLGGMGTWYLGAHHPELFSAAIPVAAVPAFGPGHADRSALAEFVESVGRGDPAVWHDGLRRLHFCAVNSRADELIPFEPVERAVRELQRRGADLEFFAVDGVGHYDSPAFAEAMQPAVQWLTHLWSVT
jgi:predicted esterase